jgi:hypothetical protein
MSLIQFHRIKCKKCGNKFTITSNHFCKECSFLGVPCTHKELCFNCFKDAVIANKIFFGGAIAIVLTMLNAIGGRIL